MERPISVLWRTASSMETVWRVSTENSALKSEENSTIWKALLSAASRAAMGKLLYFSKFSRW